MKPEEILKY